MQINLERIANAPITEGIHAFKITSGEEGEGAKGTYWKFTATCLTPGEEGKSAFLFVSLSPQARWRLESFLDAVGAPTTGTATMQNFIGRQFRSKVQHEMYEGKRQARLADLFPMTRLVPTVKVEPQVEVKRAETTPVAELPFDIVGGAEPEPFG